MVFYLSRRETEAIGLIDKAERVQTYTKSRRSIATRR